MEEIDRDVPYLDLVSIDASAHLDSPSRTRAEVTSLGAGGVGYAPDRIRRAGMRAVDHER